MRLPFHDEIGSVYAGQSDLQIHPEGLQALLPTHGNSTQTKAWRESNMIRLTFSR